MPRRRLPACLALLAPTFQDAHALNQVRSETRTDEAVSAFGVDGRGVAIAIPDRGIDWSHPAFIGADGHTRIRALLDVSGQNLRAAGDPAPVECGPAQIDAALAGAVGHGTATAGTAAGNGRALPVRRKLDAAIGSDRPGRVVVIPGGAVTGHQAPGRLSDYAATRPAIVSGNPVDRAQWTGLGGNPQSITDEGAVGDPWLKSSAGPTRDGRVHGVDINAPGQNLFAPVGPHSSWETLRRNLPQYGNGYYVRFDGNSGAAPILVGAVALMLQANPRLSAREVRRLPRAGARADGHAGAAPNPARGCGQARRLRGRRRRARRDLFGRPRRRLTEPSRAAAPDADSAARSPIPPPTQPDDFVPPPIPRRTP